MADGTWAEMTLPVLIMAVCVFATWVLITRTTTGRQLYAFGDNPEGARRFGINIGAMQFIAFGWLGLMAGSPDWCRRITRRKSCPMRCTAANSTCWPRWCWAARDLAAARAACSAAFWACCWSPITQNGLNLLGVSPFAFKMIVGAIILAAITLSNTSIERILPFLKSRRAVA